MPDFINRGTEQIMPKAALVLAGQFLRQYCQQYQLTLLTESDLPAATPDDGSFWCLEGPELAVVVTARPQNDDRVVVTLTAEAAVVEAFFGPAGLESARFCH
jgi:two-component system sensor histidine kinase/response regulator